MVSYCNFYKNLRFCKKIKKINNFSKEFNFLSSTLQYFLNNASYKKLFKFIGKQIFKLVNDSIIIVNEFDSNNNITVVRSINGKISELRKIRNILDRNPIGLSFNFLKSTRKRMKQGKLAEVRRIYDFTFNQMPLHLAKKIEKELKIHKIYAMPFVWKGDFLGSVAILTHKNKPLKNKHLIEVFVNQATMALKHKKVEEVLEKSEYKLRKIMESKIIGIIVFDSNYILEANDAFLKMVGYTKKDLINKKMNWLKMTPPEYVKADKKAIKELEKKGISTPYEKEYYHKDESCVPILIGAVKLQNNPLLWVSFVLDISKQKELEKRKDEFISDVSHELKAPLTIIKSYAQILEKRFTQNKDVKNTYFLSNITYQIDKITSLINDLLNLGRIEAGKIMLNKEEFDLDALIKKIVIDFQYMTETHQIFKEGELNRKVMADQDRIRQVLINLLTNAIKYSPNANKIIIRVAQKEKYAVASVQDFGTGIPKNEQKKIFKRFYRLKNKKEDKPLGFGLGLFITSEIVKRHGGKIWIKSQVGKGSTFYFTIPLA